MTRKHMNAIAEELKSIKPRGSAKLNQWCLTCVSMADVCEHFNPAFKRSLFYKACGYTE